MRRHALHQTEALTWATRIVLPERNALCVWIGWFGAVTSATGATMSTKHAAHGMSYASTFRRLAAQAADRARADLDNPNFGKHRGRDGAPLTYTPRAAEAV